MTHGTNQATKRCTAQIELCVGGGWSIGLPLNFPTWNSAIVVHLWWGVRIRLLRYNWMHRKGFFLFHGCMQICVTKIMWDFTTVKRHRQETQQRASTKVLQSAPLTKATSFFYVLFEKTSYPRCVSHRSDLSLLSLHQWGSRFVCDVVVVRSVRGCSLHKCKVNKVLWNYTQITLYQHL